MGCAGRTWWAGDCGFCFVAVSSGRSIYPVVSRARWTEDDLERLEASRTVMALAGKNGRLAPRGVKVTANGLTKFVLSFLEAQGVEAWRDNTGGVFDLYKAADLVLGWIRSGGKGMTIKEVRQGLKSCYRKSHERIGKPDVAGYSKRMGGRAVFVEVKVGKDELSPEQRLFLEQARRAGCIALVARSEDQFIEDWRKEVIRVLSV